MEYNNFNYVILLVSEITNENSAIDFSQLLNTNANMLRKNKDGSKVIVKYSGNKPSFLNNKTIYTHEQILSIVNDTDGDWCVDDEVEIRE